MRLRVPYAADGERPHWANSDIGGGSARNGGPAIGTLNLAIAGNTLAIETAAVVASSLSY